MFRGDWIAYCGSGEMSKINSLIKALQMQQALGEDFEKLNKANKPMSNIFQYVENYSGDTGDAIRDIIVSCQDTYAILSKHKDVIDEIKIFDEPIEQVLNDIYIMELELEKSLD